MLTLFHYHCWTPNVEQMEKFYRDRGFEVTLRLAKDGNSYRQWNPPLEWNDFRDKLPQFRTVEVRHEKVNVTFGQGKRRRLDHIGFLVNEPTYHHTLLCANQLGLRIKEGERRTFVTVPWGLRIELQTREDVVDITSKFHLRQLELTAPELKRDDAQLLGHLLGAETAVEPGTILIKSQEWAFKLTGGQALSLTHALCLKADESLLRLSP